MSCFPEPESLPTRRSLLCALAGLIAATPLRASDLRLLEPPGEPPPDSGLASLLDRMRKAVSARDRRALETLLSPTFRVEFDAGKGPAAFRRHWKPDSPATPLWTVLERLLDLGGTLYSPTLFAAPYVYTQFPTDLDLLGHVVAFRDAVPLCERPEPGTPAVAVARHTILPLAQPLAPPVLLSPGQFLEVKHPEAGRCFVSSGDVYSPAGHRAFFEKRAGRWHWITLAAATLADPPDLLRLRRGR